MTARRAPDLPWNRPLGARPRADGQTDFRVWAPHAAAVTVVAANGAAEHPLPDVDLGVFSGAVPLRAGDRYWLALDPRDGGRRRRLPDPCTRDQPRGLRGPSQVLDTAAFEWTDDDFEPPALVDLVLYELHIGTFTPEGTFDAAIAQLANLARARRQRDRADARRGLPRAARLGL